MGAREAQKSIRRASARYQIDCRLDRRKDRGSQGAKAGVVVQNFKHGVAVADPLQGSDFCSGSSLEHWMNSCNILRCSKGDGYGHITNKKCLHLYNDDRIWTICTLEVVLMLQERDKNILRFSVPFDLQIASDLATEIGGCLQEVTCLQPQGHFATGTPYRDLTFLSGRCGTRAQRATKLTRTSLRLPPFDATSQSRLGG